MSELLEKLERNARFYSIEAMELGKDSSRRDRRCLGAEEAATISQLLREAADKIKAGEMVCSAIEPT